MRSKSSNVEIFLRKKYLYSGFYGEITSVLLPYVNLTQLLSQINQISMATQRNKKFNVDFRNDLRKDKNSFLFCVLASVDKSLDGIAQHSCCSETLRLKSPNFFQLCFLNLKNK